jgi:epoxyqueuosine reductase
MKPEHIQSLVDSSETTRISEWGYVEGEIPSSYMQYEQWVQRGDYHPLHYMADHRKDIRSSLKSYYPDFESALVFLFNYTDEKKIQNSFYESTDSNGLKISSYALSFEGEDYHQVIQNELNSFGHKLQETLDKLDYRLAIDIHPVLDRDLAYRAGLGWFGKNSMLINPKQGSFFMIGSLLLSQKLELPMKSVETDHCGSCQACVRDCPTLAIDEKNRQIIASRCISTFTIETFKPAPPIEGHVENGSGEIFGCDICQDVCPWNRRPIRRAREREWTKSSKSSFLRDFFLTPPPEEVEAALKKMSKREFKRVFKHTSLERTGRDGMIKNIQLFTKNS